MVDAESGDLRSGGSRENGSKDMLDRVLGGEDSGASYYDAQRNGNTSVAPIDTISAMIVASQSECELRDPDEIARLAYLMQCLTAHYARRKSSCREDDCDRHRIDKA